MKRFKLSIALLSSGLMAFSPVTQASITAEQRAAFNANIREASKGTYGDLLRVYGPLLDSTSQSHLKAWQKEMGNRKLPKVEAQTIKGKNKQELIKLVVSDMGFTMVVLVDPQNPDQVEINGARFEIYELLDIPAAFKKMAETNKKIQEVASTIQADRTPASAPKGPSPSLIFAKFHALKPVDRVEYLQYMRETMEAAQDVIATVQTEEPAGKKTSQFILHPLIAAQLAWADAREGMSCVVAGGLSVYHYDDRAKKHLACDPFDTIGDYNSKCQRDGDLAKSKGKLVACNPLVYGFRSDSPGIPYCVDTTQPDFTNFATKECNRKSPIDEPDPAKFAKQTAAEKEAYRRKSYRRILESYALGTDGKSADKIKACFTAEDRVQSTSDCKDIFQQHQTRFFDLMSTAKNICADSKQKTKDQPAACHELLRRDLWLNVHLNGHPDVKPINLIAEGCEKAGGKYENDVCKCPDGSNAKEGATGNEFTCQKDEPAVVTTPTPQPAKDEDKKGGFCSGGWKWVCGIGIIAFIASLFRSKSKPKQPPVVIPPIVIPPVVTPPSEGNNGQTNTGNSGGVRSPQPQPKSATGAK